MADLTVVNPGLLGAVMTPVAPTATTGDKFAVQRGGKYLVYVKNGSGAGITVTFDDPNSVGPESATSFNPDVVQTVAAGVERIFKIPANRFIATDGKVAFNCGATITSVTVAVVGPINN